MQQYFYPDQRNLGGRCMIISQTHNHRISLQTIKEKKQQYEYRSPPSKQSKSIPQLNLDQLQHSKTLLKHQSKIKEIQDQPFTDRPSLFFRRIPSPNKKDFIPLLTKRPLSYRKQQNSRSVLNLLQRINKQSSKIQFQVSSPPTQRNVQLSLIPEYSLINWNVLLEELDKVKVIDKPFLKKIAIRHQIYTDNDFAILIRILLQTFKTFKQEQLVTLFAEIIEELEC